jgi:hypothetical protein
MHRHNVVLTLCIITSLWPRIPWPLHCRVTVSHRTVASRYRFWKSVLNGHIIGVAVQVQVQGTIQTTAVDCFMGGWFFMTIMELV